MLMATERGKDWVFLGIGVRIYKMELICLNLNEQHVV